jgi:hypothetical protein
MRVLRPDSTLFAFFHHNIAGQDRVAIDALEPRGKVGALLRLEILCADECGAG